MSYLIKPEAITTDNVEIKLWLKQPPQTKTKSFYIYEIGKEDNDPIAQFSVKKGVNEDTEDLDLDEIDDKSNFTIALYEKEHDKQTISNTLQLSIPGTHPSLHFLFCFFCFVLFLIDAVTKQFFCV